MAEKDDMYMTGESAFKAYASQKDEDIERQAIPRGRAQASNYRTFENWDSNISVRGDYNRADYE